MWDDITMQRRLSLAGRIYKIIPDISNTDGLKLYMKAYALTNKNEHYRKRI